jgi:hypothetical protein
MRHFIRMVLLRIFLYKVEKNQKHHQVYLRMGLLPEIVLVTIVGKLVTLNPDIVTHCDKTLRPVVAALVSKGKRPELLLRCRTNVHYQRKDLRRGKGFRDPRDIESLSWSALGSVGILRKGSNRSPHCSYWIVGQRDRYCRNILLTNTMSQWKGRQNACWCLLRQERVSVEVLTTPRH